MYPKLRPREIVQLRRVRNYLLETLSWEIKITDLILFGGACCENFMTLVKAKLQY